MGIRGGQAGSLCPLEMQINRSASPFSDLREASKRQGSCSGYPRPKPVRIGNPVIHPAVCIDVSALPEPPTEIVEKRVALLRSATRPTSISIASASSDAGL